MGYTDFAFLSEQAEEILRYAIANAKNNLVYFGGFRDHILFVDFKDELENFDYLKKYSAATPSGSSHILTSSGRDYFNNKTIYQHKEAQEMFVKLLDSARNLLIKLIENKENLNDYVSSIYNDDNKYDLNKIFVNLRDNGYLKVSFASNIAYFVSLTYAGEHYFELEEEYVKQQKQTQAQINQIYNYGDHSINQIGDHATAVQNNYADIDKIIEDIKSSLDDKMPQEKQEEIIENVEFIKEELHKPTPSKSLIKNCVGSLKNIVVQFPELFALGANIATLIIFLQAQGIIK